MNNNTELPLDNDKFKEILKKIDDHLLKVEKPSLLITSAQMTQTIIFTGIERLYKEKIKFIHTLSSPYSYVPITEIEKAINLAQRKNNILAIKEPSLNLIGSRISIMQAKDDGANIIVVPREIDALDVAINNTDKNVIFFSVDSEANSPSLAGLILEAFDKNIDNLTVLAHNRLLPPAIRNLLEVLKGINGFIAPGDLTILTGMQTWDFLPNDYQIPVSVGGFNALSILKAIEAVLNMQVNKYNSVINNYTDLVNRRGNPVAQEKTYKVFSPKTIEWEGFGLIPFSGLSFNEDYINFDANEKFKVTIEESRKENICKDVLKGHKNPMECKYFKSSCTPENTMGCSMGLEYGICNIIHKAISIPVPDITDYKQVIN